MNLIDTHTHLYLKDFSADLRAVVERATTNGVTKFVLPAIEHAEYKMMEKVEKEFPGKIYLMAGLHPCSVRENYEDELASIEIALQKRSFVAIGETGLDFYWDKTFVKEQYLALERQIKWASNYKLPVVLHTRNAMQESIDVIASHRSYGLRGIFHCFSGSLENAKDIIDLGFFLGIGGVITYKNSGLGEIIKDIELKHIVLETDSPYLAPVPFRGKRNESSYLQYIVDRIAAIKEISSEQVAEQTTANAIEIFSLS